MIKLPEWFHVGAKIYLNGMTPAYEVVEILNDRWIAKDEFGDKVAFPLLEVKLIWSPIINSSKEV
jgi:hypothetical protein